MFHCLLRVKISGPDVLNPDAKMIIIMAVDEFMSRKNAKVGYRSLEDMVGNVVVTVDDVNIKVSVGSKGGADEVGGQRYRCSEDKDRDEVNEDKDRSEVIEDEDRNEVSEDEDKNEVNEDEETEAIAHRLKLPVVGDTGSSDDSSIESDEEFDAFEEF